MCVYILCVFVRAAHKNTIVPRSRLGSHVEPAGIRSRGRPRADDRLWGQIGSGSQPPFLPPPQRAVGHITEGHISSAHGAGNSSCMRAGRQVVAAVHYKPTGVSLL